jgi:hypothetical protein
LPPNHFLAGDRTLMTSARLQEAAAAISGNLPREAIHGLPDTWLADFGVTHDALLCALRNYVESLAG